MSKITCYVAKDQKPSETVEDNSIYIPYFLVSSEESKFARGFRKCSCGRYSNLVYDESIETCPMCGKAMDTELLPILNPFMNGSLDWDIVMGVHSGYPICCVMFWKKYKGQYKYTDIEKAKIEKMDYRYRPCPECVKNGFKVIGHKCDPKNPVCEMIKKWDGPLYPDGSAI